VVDEPARGGGWTWKHNWVSGPNQRTQPARVWGQMARMAKLDRQKSLRKPDKKWPATIHVITSGGLTRCQNLKVKGKHCRCGFLKNPSLKRKKCHGCENRMQTKSKRLDGIVFTNADRENRWSARRWHDNADAAGKRSHDGNSRVETRIKLDLDNVRADGVSAVVGIFERESRWSWKFETMQRLVYWSNRIFLASIITDFIQNTKRELYDEKLEDALEILDLEWSKGDDTKMQCNR